MMLGSTQSFSSYPSQTQAPLAAQWKRNSLQHHKNSTRRQLHKMLLRIGVDFDLSVADAVISNFPKIRRLYEEVRMHQYFASGHGNTLAPHCWLGHPIKRLDHQASYVIRNKVVFCRTLVFSH